MKYSTERDWLVDTYKRAYKGDNAAISELADTYVGWGYRDNGKYFEEAVFWAERYSQPNALFEYECWLDAYCYVGNPEKALELYYPIKTKIENRGGMFLNELYMSKIGDAFFKKKDPDKAIQCYEKAGKDGYEGLGDCYAAKGNKQLAASYYRKCLSLDYYYGKNRVEKKLKDLRQ
jgi:tetratricopeptide (TPR) repeat protein